MPTITYGVSVAQSLVARGPIHGSAPKTGSRSTCSVRSLPAKKITARRTVENAIANHRGSRGLGAGCTSAAAPDGWASRRGLISAGSVSYTHLTLPTSDLV